MLAWVVFAGEGEALMPVVILGVEAERNLFVKQHFNRMLGRIGAAPAAAVDGDEPAPDAEGDTAPVTH